MPSASPRTRHLLVPKRSPLLKQSDSLPPLTDPSTSSSPSTSHKYPILGTPKTSLLHVPQDTASAMTFDPLDPWYFTVVRTQGIQFVRSEKSCRPIVSVSVINGGHTDIAHETTLGTDGQNPNLKSPLILRAVNLNTRFDISVHHKRSGKQRTKRNLIGSTYISVNEVLRRQPRPGADVDIKLSCPPPQKRSPSLVGDRKLGSASIILRLRSPSPVSLESSSATMVGSPSTSIHEEDVFSDEVLSDALSIRVRQPTVDSSTANQVIDEITSLLIDDTPTKQSSSSLRRRRKPPRVKGYHINTTTDEEVLSSAESISCPPSPADPDPAHLYPNSHHSHNHHHHHIHHHQSFKSFDIVWEDENSDGQSSIVKGSECDSSKLDAVYVVPPPSQDWIAPRILPQYTNQMSLMNSFTFAESLLDKIAPYKELTEASGEAEVEKVLGRLLTEWYVAGGSLLAVAAANAAAFGFASGDTLFEVKQVARQAVAIGSICAGLGILMDAWLLVIYSSVSVPKFQRMALDVYNTYFFFCLTCRLPMLLLLISAGAMMVFLLAVAWEAWRTAVLVLSCLTGVLVTLQYLVFGFHRFINAIVWVVRGIWKCAARRLGRGGERPSEVAVVTDGGPAASTSPAQAVCGRPGPHRCDDTCSMAGDKMAGPPMPEPDLSAAPPPVVAGPARIAVVEC